MHTNLMVVMAATAVVKLMKCKRFTKAVASKEPIPDTIVSNLRETLSTCQDLGLQIPAQLQAHALHFVGSNGTQ